MDKLKEVFTQIGRDIGSIQEASYLTEEKARNIFPTNVAVDRQILAVTSTLATKAELEELKRPAENANLTEERAYELFPTYATLQSQMTTNIKEKHVELGLDALIDTKLANGGDPFVTRSKLPTIDTSTLATKNDLEELKRTAGNANLTEERAYELFPTYATLQSQMTTNIKEKHVELGLDALIDTKLANGGDPFVTRSKLPTIDTSTLATKNDLEELKRTAGTGSTSTELKGQGFPYNLNADIGTIYTDTTAKNGAVKWIKKTAGTGSNAWSVLFGDVKHKPRISSSQNNAYVEFRRINSTVEIGFGGLSWGWFGIVRRGAPSYIPQGSDRERNVVILNVGGIPVGFRATSSKLGIMTNDKGKRLGTFYLGGPGDGNQLRLQFDDPVPTDRDIGDLRFTNMSYTTDDPWPETL